MNETINMKQEMLINVAQPEECRIAIVEDGVLEELYIERTSQDNYVGNIYKGRIVNLEPSIQAAFVDFGVGRNGFLHISDVEPQYFRQGGYDPDKPIHAERRAVATTIDDRERRSRRTMAATDAARRWTRDGGRGRGRRRRTRPATATGVRPRIKPPIQDIFHRGDEVLVQVIKEGIGTKGPTLSTYISIPGRYLVLMPALGRDRRLAQDRGRRRPPPAARHPARAEPAQGRGLHRPHRRHRPHEEGAVARPGVPAAAVEGDRAPDQEDDRRRCDIYEESDMIIRTIRDIFTGDVDAIYIDEPKAFERAKEFLQIVMPRYVSRLQLYEGREPLFHKYKLDEEIAQINQRKVPLRGGGSIVIDQTEALVAIDVNSGNFRTDGSAEESAYQLNQIAAKEIARQLRLRDLGGVMVNDFIDMRKERHRRGVERTLRDAVKRDRARTKILRTSPFGLIEMTRQRIRPSLKRSVYKECPSCSGTGLVKTAESMAIEVVRKLIMRTHLEQVAQVTVTVEEEVANYLNNKKRRELVKIEDDNNVEVQVVSGEGLSPEYLKIDCVDANGREVKFPD